MPRPEHGLQYKTPAMVWDEALPLGNGIMGALVWGDGQPLKVSLDRSDLWDLRLVPEFYSDEYKWRIMRDWHEQGRVADLIRVYEKPYNRPAPTKIPAGRIELVFGDDKFSRTSLTLADATAHFHLDNGTDASLMVHAVEPVGMISIRAAAPSEVRLVAPAFGGKVSEAAAAGGIGAGDLRQLEYAAPRETSGENWRAF